MLIVADTSPLLALASCDSLQLLPAIFDAVRVPEAVYREGTTVGKPHAAELQRFLEGRVALVDLSTHVILGPDLGPGEMAAMALYKHLGADQLLVDDLRARKVARLNGMRITGTIGVLLLAKEKGLIPEIRPRLDKVRADGHHVSDQLWKEALELANEL